MPVSLDPNGPLALGATGTLTYDAGTGQFHSDTSDLTLSSATLLSGPVPIGSGQTTVDLLVDVNGDFVASGAGVSIIGSLDLDADGTDDVAGTLADPLLFGPITAFGAEAPGPPPRTFNGLFDIAGGRLTQTVSLSGGGSVGVGFVLGAPGAFVLHAPGVVGGTLGDFQEDFSAVRVTSEVGVIAAVPAPPTLALTLAASAFVALSRASRRRDAPLVPPARQG